MTTPTPGVITSLKPNEVFVFGSNEAGRHGRGAALVAKQWGARNGEGVGLWGQTYAIPTKDSNIQTLPIGSIRDYVNDFIQFAIVHPDKEFLVTRIGCGLAGYNVKDMAPLFFTALYVKNIHLPEDFIEYLKQWSKQ